MAKLGIIGIDRGIMKHPLFASNEPLSKREAWLWMLCEASYKPRVKDVGGVMVKLQRGQFTHSVRFMAEAWKWSKSKADRWVKRLSDEGMIEIQATCPADRQLKMSWSKSGTASGTGQSIVTICNYDTFQNFNLYRGTGSGTIVGQERDSTGTNLTPDATPDATPNIEGDEPPPPKPKKRASRISNDWQPDEQDLEHAKSKGYFQKQTAKLANEFRDWHLARSGQGATARDWNAKWRTWLANDIKFHGNPDMQRAKKNGTPGNGRGTGSVNAAFDAIDEHRREQEPGSGNGQDDWAGAGDGEIIDH